MMIEIKNFILTLIVFLSIDFVYLGLVAKNFYNQQLASFNRALNLPAAFLSYLLLVLGIVVFVLPKTSGGWNAFVYGALFGLIAYGVYDLVNLATLADWSLTMTVVDILWGMVVCGLVSALTTIIINYLK